MADTAPQRSAILVAAVTATVTLAGAVTVAGLFGWIQKPEPTSSPSAPTVFVPIVPSTAAPPAVVDIVEPAAEPEFATKKHHKHHHEHEHEEHDDDD